MKKGLRLANSLFLLAAPLVASANLGISPSNAAIVANDERRSKNTQEIIDRLGALDLDTANFDAVNFDAVNQDSSDRKVLVTEELLSIVNNSEFDLQTHFKEDVNSLWGNLSTEIKGVFGPNSETEYNPIALVNNVRLSRENIQAFYSFYPISDRDPLRTLLRSLNLVDGSGTNKNQAPSRTYTGRVEPVEINPSAVDEDSTETRLPQIQPPQKTYTAVPISRAMKVSTTPKMAQLPLALRGDPEDFDYTQLAGGALGLGFFIWMLFQD